LKRDAADAATDYRMPGRSGRRWRCGGSASPADSPMSSHRRKAAHGSRRRRSVSVGRAPGRPGEGIAWGQPVPARDPLALSALPSVRRPNTVAAP